MQAVYAEKPKPRLLFVDDEQRVLNSMRIMFRRDFELFLASRGSEALDIVKAQDIDVIVADHRMPQMTGVEVLTRVRALSPRTVRILLTGYADLDAVEGSINEGEVFRFLTKPCAPRELRKAIQLAARAARTGNTAVAAADDPARSVPARHPEARPAPQRAPGAELVERDLGDTDVLEASAAVPARPTPVPRRGLGVIVFSADAAVLETVHKAVRARLPVHHAGNIVQVVKILTEHRPGVLLTDISEDRATLQSMTARLKEHLPELVTIAVAAHRDVLDMVWLINHGQIFRFLRKPLSPGRCTVALQAALNHHRMLLDHPELVKRHAVNTNGGEHGLLDGMLERLKAVRKLWQSA